MSYKRSYKGKFLPKNPTKWFKPTKIIYRSGIEFRYFTYFDNHPDVTYIGSENVIVPYFDPVKCKMRKYYVDLIVTFTDKYNKQKTILIEIKSSQEAKAPKKQKRITESYKNRVESWSTNTAKWQAASAYAEAHGWIFKVFTEKDI
jgi:hypothetical protein